MRTRITPVVLFALVLTGTLAVWAQPPQIPTVQIPNATKAEGEAQVVIANRKDAAHAGTFDVRLSVNYAPATDEYPAGNVTIRVNLTDSLRCTVASTTVEEVTSYGKHNPTMVLSGRCKVDPGEEGERPSGCRYWLLVANNTGRGTPDVQVEKPTPDIISFLVVDKAGKRIAYGTGPVEKGDVVVFPAP